MDTQTPAGHDAGSPGPTPGTGPGPHPGTTPPPAPNGFWAGVRGTGLYRSDERWVGGVAGGLAARLGVDPLLVRGVLAVSFLIGGLGLVLYGVAWALLPDARDGRILLERLGAGDADGALLGSLAFVVVGLARGDGWWWFWDGGGGGLLWLLSVAGAAALVVLVVQRRSRWSAAHRPPGAPPFAGPPAPGARPPAGPPPVWQATSAPTTTSTHSVGAPTDAPTMPLPPHAPGGPAVPPPPYPPYGSAPPPRKAPRTSPRGSDGATVGAVVGLSVVALGVLLLAERIGSFDGPVGLTAGGIAIVIAGLAIVTLGLRGRTSGFVGFLAVVGIIVWTPAALAHQSSVPDSWSDAIHFADRAPAVTTVTSRSAAAEGISLGAGQARVDLTGLPLEDEVLVVPISIGAGQVTVVVPAEAAVQASVSSGIGSVRWELDDDVHERSGIGIGDVTWLDDDASAGEPNLVLDISSGVGEVRIIEEAAA